MTNKERAEEVAMSAIRAYDAVGITQAGLEVLTYADEIRREAWTEIDGRQDGGPAFPCEEIKQAIPVWHNGMTLRDYFAGQALAGMASLYLQASGTSDEIARANAKVAYLMADAMLAERGKK